MKKNLKYILLLLFITLLFGISFIPVKVLMNADYPVFFMIAARFFIAAATLVIFKSQPITRKDVSCGVTVGLFVLAGYILQTIGARYTTPAKNGLYTGLYVIFVPIIMMIARRKFTLKPLLVSLLCFAGVALVSDVFSDVSYNTGDFLTTLCALAFALQIIFLSKYSKALHPVNFTITQMLTVAVISAVISLCTETPRYASLSFDRHLLTVVLLGLFPTGLAMLIQTHAQAKLPANTAAVILCMESVFALVSSVIFGYDALSLTLVLGSAVIIASMVIAARTPAESL